jgi:crotonobetainyl-CoA:carnitine CoA-transferase CaiB-like acyl-CoA transferase
VQVGVDPLLRSLHAVAFVAAAMTSDALIERLNEAGIPYGPIYTIDQTFADPQVRHLGIAQAVESSALGPIKLVGQPFTLSRTPSRLSRAHRNMASTRRSFSPSSAIRARRSRDSASQVRSRTWAPARWV